MLVLKILPDFRKVQLFPAQNPGARQLPHPRKPPMPHDDGSATDRAGAWRARKTKRRLHTACSEPARANCSVCLRLHWVGVCFLSFYATAQPNCGCLNGFARVRGLHCSGTHYYAEW